MNDLEGIWKEAVVMNCELLPPRWHVRSEEGCVTGWTVFGPRFGPWT